MTHMSANHSDPLIWPMVGLLEGLRSRHYRNNDAPENSFPTSNNSLTLIINCSTATSPTPSGAIDNGEPFIIQSRTISGHSSVPWYHGCYIRSGMA